MAGRARRTGFRGGCSEPAATTTNFAEDCEGPRPISRISTLFSCFASPMLPRKTLSAHEETSNTTFASWTSPCLMPASFNVFRAFRASAAHALTRGRRWTRGSINHRSFDPNPGRLEKSRDTHLRGAFLSKTASKSEKKPLSAFSDGDESRRRREGTLGRRDRTTATRGTRDT